MELSIHHTSSVTANVRKHFNEDGGWVSLLIKTAPRASDPETIEVTLYSRDILGLVQQLGAIADAEVAS
jgi:hypothetical protein